MYFFWSIKGMLVSDFGYILPYRVIWIKSATLSRGDILSYARPPGFVGISIYSAVIGQLVEMVHPSFPSVANRFLHHRRLSIGV